MMEQGAFLQGSLHGPGDSSEGKTLLEYKSRLEALWRFLSYGVDYRDITGDDIDRWEDELRSIIGGIERLRDEPHTYSVITTCDGIQKNIRKAIRCLYMASKLTDRLDISDMETMFQKYEECAEILKELIEKYYKI